MERLFNWRKRRQDRHSRPSTAEASTDSHAEPINYYTRQESVSCPTIIDTAPRDTQLPLRGYKKRFHECLDYNISLIKERLPDENLTCEQYIIGKRGQKKVVMVYLQDLANPGIVTEVRNKIRAIKAETLLDSSYLERNIEDSNLSPFPQVEITLQPDLTEAALLQGRVAILLDGSPETLLAPTTFFDLMDTPEDVYSRWFIAANFFRIARYIMFLMAASLPAFYIALTSHNPECYLPGWPY